MLTVRTADYAADRDDICAIRFTVFVDEQQVPEEIELDDRDPHCVHVLAFDEADAVGTGRIDLAQDGKVGRVAVLASQRDRGVGTAVMQAIHAIARTHGLKRVWCHAQVSAQPFYEGLGYLVTSDEPFDEAGIPHVRMERRL